MSKLTEFSILNYSAVTESYLHVNLEAGNDSSVKNKPLRLNILSILHLFIFPIESKNLNHLIFQLSNWSYLFKKVILKDVTIPFLRKTCQGLLKVYDQRKTVVLRHSTRGAVLQAIPTSC